MACTVCGSTVVPCGCSQVRVANSARCPTPNTGCCTPNVQSVPVPFYQCADPCQESHNERIVLQQYNTSIKVNNSWNVPSCGNSAIINVAGLKSFVPGSYIWNPTYGFFEGTAFDAATGDLTIVNHCNDGNAAPGTGVPACTNFDVTVPPCDCPDANNTCVAIDFTAPAIGDCIDITLTNTNNLRSSDTIQIGTGFYFVSAVKANNIITICNQGEGITPGTPVIAKDTAGNYQYCISIINVNPCDSDPVIEGKALVCNGSDESVPLGGAAKGYVLTLIDDGLIEAAYRPLGHPDCATLTAVLNIISGTDIYNNVPVSDSSLFGPPLLIRFGDSTLRAEITAVPDATHISFQLTAVPVANVSFSIGTLVCLVDCCEFLFNEIEDFNVCFSPVFIEQIPDTFYSVPYSITAGNPGNAFTNLVDANVITINMPSAADCPGASYIIKATIALAALPDHGTAGASDVGVIMHEIEALWTTNEPVPKYFGKVAWTDFGADGYDIGTAYPPPDGNALWGYLDGAAPIYPMMWHQNDAVVIAENVAAGDTLVLALEYKATVGDNNYPADVNGISLLVSGFVEVYKKA